MKSLNYLKLFFIKRLLGAILLSISIFIFISLFTYNHEDMGFGNTGNANLVTNWFGVYGSFTASFLFLITGFFSYIFFAYFLINGIKLIVGRALSYPALKFFFILIGVFGLNLATSLIEVKSGLVGNITKDILYSVSVIDFKNFYFFSTLLFFTVFSSLMIIYICLGFQARIINLFLIYFFNLVVYPFRNINFNKIFKWLKVGKIRDFQPVKKTIKSEPTISRVNKKKNFPKNNILTQDKNTNIQGYSLPSLSFLETSNHKNSFTKMTEKQNIEFGKKLEGVLKEFGVDGKITQFKSGPVVTLFEFIPAAGIKTSKVVSLSEDITRAMSILSTRIALQPGKTSIGIEIPNQKRESVFLGDLIKDSDFAAPGKNLLLALGKNIAGEKKFADLEKMPHLLIAGTTGSGKSVGINSMIISLLYRFKPSECKLILIDPKMLELSIYEDIPHLLTPVVTNPNKAVFALKWVVREMEDRYKLMSTLNVKNIGSFNNKIDSTLASGRKIFKEVQTGIDKETRKPIIEKKEIPLKRLPLIVVVIDEMADLMMVAGKEVESLVQRLAQMARASGIHLIAATQRPSVDVITGTIKANFPSRISFRVASRFDSRTILNEMGAEQLLGSGDMLFLENGATLTRLHGGYISEKEIEAVVNHIKLQSSNEVQEDITLEKNQLSNNNFGLDLENKNVDELYEKALGIIIDQQKVSTSFVQRYLQIGYNRAARIVEKMEEDGYISEPSHSGKRSVLKKNK